MEHRYLCWGNTNCYVAELNEDMISVTDENGDGHLTMGDDIHYQTINGMNGSTYTEAPWIYRRQDENGAYYGQYYLFYAMNWRDEMVYATRDDLSSNEWTYGGKLMVPSATSNTNHMAVFDFNGHTYFIYHNGFLPWGSGYRRVTCIEEMTFYDDGSIEYIEETSTGISGTASQILDGENTPIAHANFTNSGSNSDYPYVGVSVNVDKAAAKSDAMWEIENGKSDKTNASYVSIQSYNKPGLYLKANADYSVTLDQDYQTAGSTGLTVDSDAMTFRTLEGFDGAGVTFESVAYPGYYLTSQDGALVLTTGSDASACSFEVSGATDLSAITAQKTTRTYKLGDTVKDTDIRVHVIYEDGTEKTITTGFTSNATSINTSKSGSKTLKVTYTEKGIEKSCEVKLTVLPASAKLVSDLNTVKTVPVKNSTATVGNLKYKVTKSDCMNTDGTNGTVTVTGCKSSKLTSVSIPATVKIDGYTFKVTAISSKAFYKQSKLKTIKIGDNVKSIGKNAISGIYKKAIIKVSSSRYAAVKKLLKSTTGYKKTMTLKKIS